MRFSLVVVGCFVGFYIDVLIFTDFLYVFVKFCSEAICCIAVGFKLYSLDHIKEGGVRVRGDAVLRYFWCGFAEIFILTYGIAVL